MGDARQRLRPHRRFAEAAATLQPRHRRRAADAARRAAIATVGAAFGLGVEGLHRS